MNKIVFCVACLLTCSFNLLYAQPEPQPEVIYQLFQRSFYDSNGDKIGDLNGVYQKLDYLQDLGVTSILLLPLQQSVYYHNYFATDYKNIDDEFGTAQDYIKLVKEIHRRGMKLYLDMEMQYVTEDHAWWKESYGKPASPYKDYILYEDAQHTKPSTIVFNAEGLLGYDSVYKKITTANLNNAAVQQYHYEVLSYYVDPNKDGEFDDGADGFRLDHMMDDLDNKGKLTNLLRNYWKPMFTRLKQQNPKLKFIAEQANWNSFGSEYFSKAGIDKIFGFRLQQAFASFDKEQILAMTDATFDSAHGNQNTIAFIENHDMQRFAVTAKKDIEKEKAAAALNLLTGGTALIYYGQELGMYGAPKQYGTSDGNDISQREAFEWNAADSGKGMAYWYKNSGPWWDGTNNIANDGISLEEEKNHSNSLYNFYKTIVQLRNHSKPLSIGTYRHLDNDNDHIFTFIRKYNDKRVAVAINLSDSTQQAEWEMNGSIDKFAYQSLYGDEKLKFEPNKLILILPPYGVSIWEER